MLSYFSKRFIHNLEYTVLKNDNLPTTQELPNIPTVEESISYNGYFTPPSHLKVKNEPSSEELFVADFLKDSGFKFKTEVPLYNLHGDTKKFRKVDFHLTNLGVYVEYFGQYNANKVRRAEYDKKAEVYIKNSIPTIFIYPHELGFLEYAFHYKMVKLLKVKKFNFKKNLFKYRLSRFKQHFKSTTDMGGAMNLGLSVYTFFFLYFVETGLAEDVEFAFMLSSTFWFLYNIKRVITDIRSFFYKDE